MTPNERFLEFLEDIEPSATTKANSVSAHARVRETLRADAEFGPDVQRVFLGGSYRRHTAIRPRQKNGALDRPDIDIYVVVDAALHTTTPSAEIERLYATLDRARKTLGITRLKRNRVIASRHGAPDEKGVEPSARRVPWWGQWRRWVTKRLSLGGRVGSDLGRGSGGIRGGGS